MREDLQLDAAQHGWVRLLRWRGTLHAEHCHDELECNLFQRGHATYVVDGEAIDVQQEISSGYPDQRHILINQSEDIEALDRSCSARSRAATCSCPAWR